MTVFLLIIFGYSIFGIAFGLFAWPIIAERNCIRREKHDAMLDGAVNDFHRQMKAAANKDLPFFAKR